MPSLYVKTENDNYPILINKGNLKELTNLLPDKAKALIVTDENVYNDYADKIKGILKGEAVGYDKGINFRFRVLPPGEGTKTLDMARELYDEACEFEMDRDSFFIALGGGVVGDLTGFVASTYMRGTKFIQVPTTLLSQVDSSVGGKVAVNHPMQKNLIGNFYHPKAVLIDLEFLQTLPLRDFKAGLAEIVKSAILWDREYFFLLKEYMEKDKPQQDDELIRIIYKACDIKAEVVNLDEKDHGTRQLLNLGHTFAHALEGITNYEYFIHGEAVMWGIIFASELSYSKEIITSQDKAEIINLISKLNPPPLPRGFNPGDLRKYFATDKKRRGEVMPFIIPERIGRAAIYTGIDVDEAISVVDKSTNEMM